MLAKAPDEKTRTRFHHGDLRRALLEASLAVLDESGPDAVTIREVARRTGVSHAAPVNHFRDRKVLLTEIASRLFGELSLEIELAIARGGSSPRERIAAFADGLIRFGLSRPNRFRMLWRRDLVDHGNPELARAMDGIYDQLVAEILAADQAQSSDPDTLAVALWSMAHGYVSLRLDGNLKANSDRVTGQARFDAMVDRLIPADRS